MGKPYSDKDSLEVLNDTIVHCRKCPRLVEFREEVLRNSRRYADETFWRKPIAGFGDLSGKMMVVGLAPAASGANRTGRVFTGDKSSEILVSAFHRIGLSNISSSTSIDDGLEYNDLYLTLAVKCVPPENRPLKDEIDNCLPYLHKEIDLMSGVKSIVALGVLAFNSLKRIFTELGYDTRGARFINGESYSFGKLRVYCCYHPSPRNINTGRTDLENIIQILKEAYDFSVS